MKLGRSATTLIGFVVLAGALGACADGGSGASSTYTGPRQMDEPYTPPAAAKPSVRIHAFGSVTPGVECDESFSAVTKAQYGSGAADIALVNTAFSCGSLDEWASSARSHPTAYGVTADAMDDEFLTFAVISLCEPTDNAPTLLGTPVCLEAFQKWIISE
jgi:hypothetical protein